MKVEEKVSSEIYRTPDTALAAWLLSQGFTLLELDDSKPFSISFLFKDDSTELPKCIHDFQAAKAEGNIVAFFRAYRRLVARVKETQL